MEGVGLGGDRVERVGLEVSLKLSLNGYLKSV